MTELQRPVENRRDLSREKSDLFCVYHDNRSGILEKHKARGQRVQVFRLGESAESLEMGRDNQ